MNTEIAKVGFWFFKLNVGYSAYMLCLQLECCALNFQERVIMLHCNSAAHNHNVFPMHFKKK